MPVFKDNAPSNLRKLPIRGNSLPYLEGYESDEFCLMCRQVVTIFNYRSSLVVKHQLEIVEWESRDVLMKVQQYLRGIKRPVMGSLIYDSTECPCCEQSVFLEENEPCYNCDDGVLVVDEKFRVIY